MSTPSPAQDEFEEAPPWLIRGDMTTPLYPMICLLVYLLTSHQMNSHKKAKPRITCLRVSSKMVGCQELAKEPKQERENRQNALVDFAVCLSPERFLIIAKRTT